MKHNIIVFSMVMAALVLAGCATVPTHQAQQNMTDNVSGAGSFEPGAKTDLQSFSSVDDLQAFLAAHQGSAGYYGGGVMMRDMAGSSAMMDGAAMVKNEEAVAAPTAAQTTGAGSPDYSGTNVQVAGVDEGDIIKTDGQFIYTVSGQTLFVVKAVPGANASVLSRVQFTQGQPSGLFIDGDQLVVFGQVSDYSIFENLSIPASTQMTFVDVYDISDKVAPKKVKEYLFEGGYTESRMVDGTAYIITQEYPQYRPRPLPMIVEDGVARDVAVSSVKYMPIAYDSVSFVGINAVDLASLKSSTETITVESGTQVYMSQNNIYLASTKYINEWQIQQDVMISVVQPMLSDADQALIKKVNAVDDAVLSKDEKKQKVMNIVSRYVQYLPSKEQDALEQKIQDQVDAKLKQYDYFEYTIVNKIAVNGLQIEPSAYAQVPGSLNNQFSMDEFDDVLRIATTTSQRWMNGNWTESQNHLYTLDADLKVLDKIDDIAPGESIYAARFMGDRLYLVTFKQTDPFFVYDLSNPKDIKVLGKLKIPGFSRYLHPYDATHVIGIGQDASDSGRTQGLKISLFDVSDVAHPKEVASWVSGERYASSTAEYEHKAFLFDKQKDLLVIPAYSYSWNGNSYDGYNGALVFNITSSSITLRGLIDHEKYAQSTWQAAVERSLFIGNLLYTKSQGAIRINDLTDLHSVKDVVLEQLKDSTIPKF